MKTFKQFFNESRLHAGFKELVEDWLRDEPVKMKSPKVHVITDPGTDDSPGSIFRVSGLDGEDVLFTLSYLNWSNDRTPISWGAFLHDRVEHVLNVYLKQQREFRDSIADVKDLIPDL